MWTREITGKLVKPNPVNIISLFDKQNQFELQHHPDRATSMASYWMENPTAKDRNCSNTNGAHRFRCEDNYVASILYRAAGSALAPIRWNSVWHTPRKMLAFGRATFYSHRCLQKKAQRCCVWRAVAFEVSSCCPCVTLCVSVLFVILPYICISPWTSRAQIL